MSKSRVEDIIQYLTEVFPKKDFPDGIQTFNTRNVVGDKMTNIYNKDGVVIDYCYDYEYIEIFGLTDEEYGKLFEYDVIYGSVKKVCTTPEKRIWYFTFGVGQVNAGKCQPIKASSWGSARAKMFEMYGPKWCWQYSAEEWEELKQSHRDYPLEEELELVECK